MWFVNFTVSLIDTNKDKLAFFAAGAAGFFSVVYTVIKLAQQKRQKRIKTCKSYPRNTVILHSPGRAQSFPCYSVHCLKLETYLRLTKIPFQMEIYSDVTSLQNISWIEYKGIEIYDSQFIIEYLNKAFKRNLNSELSTTEQAISHAFLKMMEDSLYWSAGVMQMLSSTGGKTWITGLYGQGHPMINHFIKIYTKLARDRGIAAHSKDEICKIATDDLTAISNYLGEKEFMFGRNPTEVDCFMFALLAQFKYLMPGSVAADLINGRLRNLGDYCERIKRDLWPDWDSCCTKNEDREMTTSIDYF